MKFYPGPLRACALQLFLYASVFPITMSPHCPSPFLPWAFTLQGHLLRPAVNTLATTRYPISCLVVTTLNGSEVLPFVCLALFPLSDTGPLSQDLLGLVHH